MDQPNPKEAETTNKQQGFRRDLWNDLKTELRRVKFYAELAALIGLVLYVGETKRTNDLTQRALSTSKEQFAITNDLTQQALRTSNEQFRLDQRPYVWISEPGPFLRVPHGPGNTSDKLAFQLKLTNYGKSPAIHCQMDARIAIGENAWKTIVWKSLDADKGSILPPGKVDFNDAFSDQPVSEEFFRQVISPGIMKPIQVLGHIQYFGTDGTPYSSDFCFGRTIDPPTVSYCPYRNEIK
jgi:hypothetical protein